MLLNFRASNSQKKERNYNLYTRFLQVSALDSGANQGWRKVWKSGGASSNAVCRCSRRRLLFCQNLGGVRPPCFPHPCGQFLYRQLKYVLTSLKVQAVYVEKISAQQRRGKGTTYDAHFLLSSTKEFDTTVQLMPLGRGTKMTIGRTSYHTQCTVMNFVNFFIWSNISLCSIL